MSDDEKKLHVAMIMENSEFYIATEPEYRKLIEGVLWRIPFKALDKISSLLDHVELMHKGDYAGTSMVRFTCLASNHEIRLEKERIHIIRRGELKSEPKPQTRMSVLKYESKNFQKYLVILVLDNMKKLTKAQKRSVIAEEFAHVYLEHDVIGGEEKEEEAKELVKCWGFRPMRG